MKIGKSSLNTHKTKPKKNLVSALILGIIISIVFVMVLLGLKQLLATDTYYVLNKNIGAKTRITTDMLTPVEVNKDGKPVNAINNEEVSGGVIYSKIPLQVGDILTKSNTGASLDTAGGIHDDWAVTSINISSNYAVGGQISKGDYFDLIGVNDEGAKYIALNVLVLDINYNSITKEDNKGVRSIGEEIQYVIGAPPEVIASIIHASDGSLYKNLRIVQSPRSITYKERNLSQLQGIFKNTFETPVVDLFKGSDRSFTQILRDNNGRPVNQEYCSQGVIDPKELCDNIPNTPNTENVTGNITSTPTINDNQNNKKPNEETNDINNENSNVAPNITANNESENDKK